jgi:hypothetical protein
MLEPEPQNKPFNLIHSGGKLVMKRRSNYNLLWVSMTGIVLMLLATLLFVGNAAGQEPAERTGESILETVVNELRLRYVHNWDSNPVAYIPESTMRKKVPSVDVLRSARPNFKGGAVPESTMRKTLPSVDILRSAKPSFDGGPVPESTY